MHKGQTLACREDFNVGVVGASYQEFTSTCDSVNYCLGHVLGGGTGMCPEAAILCNSLVKFSTRWCTNKECCR